MWNSLERIGLFLIWSSIVLAQNLDAPKLRPYKNSAERIVEHGYPAETHTVVTEDGYILTVFRIPYAHTSSVQPGRARTVRSVVLLMHGLFCTSDIWLLNGPSDGLPFILADAGYDVWLGNSRGNHYARNHTTLDVHHPDFWNFSFHEIGYYDLAATIDYALATNGRQHPQSLHYVGHSQGTTSFFALLSSRPAYNQLIRTAHMLAPVSYINHASNVLLRLFSPYLGQDSTYTRFFAQQEVVPYNDLLLLLLFNSCGTEGTFHSLCSQLIPWVPLLQGVRRFNETIRGSITEVAPGGASSNQILHYMQLYKNGEFCLFDHGRLNNMKVYGQERPPAYPLENIVASLHLWFSDNDAFVAVLDEMRLAEQLSNKTLHHMEDPLWGHGEFLFSILVKEKINEPLLEVISEYDARNVKKIKSTLVS